MEKEGKDMKGYPSSKEFLEMQMETIPGFRKKEKPNNENKVDE